MRAHRRLVLHRASADHARPARGAAAALHLQRRAAAESESRSDSVRRAAVLLELRAGADDEVGHAGRLHARVHGRLVAGLSRLGRLQPQRHDADVRDAGGTRALERGPARSGGARSAADAAAMAAPRRSSAEARTPERDAGASAGRRSDAGGGRAAAAVAPTGRGGVAAARVVPRHCRFRRTRSPTSRAATTRTTWRPASSPVCSSRRCSRTWSLENFYRKTQNSIDAGKTRRPSATSSRSSAT